MRKKIGDFLKFGLYINAFGLVAALVFTALILIVTHYPLPARYFGYFALGWIIKGLGLRLDDIVRFDK